VGGYGPPNHPSNDRCKTEQMRRANELPQGALALQSREEVRLKIPF